MPEITLFQNIKATSTGYYRDVSVAIDRIRKGEKKDIIEKIRSEQDSNKRNELKRLLPAICFSGTFTQRNDKALVKHSGIICLDFDKYPEQSLMMQHREQLINDPYTYCLFISPSGNGLKVLVKIPAVKEEHRDYFRSLESYYKSDYFDKSCVNESRVCYESYDPDIYVNDESQIYDIKADSRQYKAGIDRPVLPLKSENQIISNINKWFDKNYTMSSGARNNNGFILASAYNDFGVNKMDAEKELSRYIDKDFTAREVENIIKSAYKNTSSHGTKFFEDEHTKKKISERIRSGDDLKTITSTFNNYTPEEITSATKDIKENLSISEFWTYDKRGNVCLSHHKYKQFLEQNGFFKMYPEGSDGFIFIKIKENLINSITPTHIKDFILEYLYADNLKVYDFMAQATKYFKEDYLTFLETSEAVLKQDTKETCYLYFKNCVVEVNEKGINKIDYFDLDAFVWEKHIIPRDFIKADPEHCEFEQFLKLVTSTDLERFKSLVCVIGYLLHSFKTNSNNKAIIFNDETISENPNGGSGKGIIMNAINKMKRVAVIDGKQFDFNKSFLYQTVSADTQVLVFDDVKRNFQFENLFSLVTEGITLEKKNKDAIKLPVTRSPKIMITTNYTIGGIGGSFERRKFEVELSSHFNEKFSPFDHFGHMLYDDWDKDEWAKFDNFMIFCVQAYLKLGLVEYVCQNLEARKLINSTSMDFYDWIIDEEIPLNENVNKSDYFSRFIAEHEDFAKTLNSRKFSRWMDAFAKYKGYDVIKNKTNGVRYTIYKLKQNA